MFSRGAPIFFGKYLVFLAPYLAFWVSLACFKAHRQVSDLSFSSHDTHNFFIFSSPVVTSVSTVNVHKCLEGFRLSRFRLTYFVRRLIYLEREIQPLPHHHTSDSLAENHFHNGIQNCVIRKLFTIERWWPQYPRH